MAKNLVVNNFFYYFAPLKEVLSNLYKIKF